MSFWSEVIFYMVAFTGCIAAGYLWANFITRGFLWGLTKVKIFGRWKGWVLVKVHTVTEPYYRVGVLKGSFLTYKPRHNKGPSGEKLEKMITIPKGAIVRNLGSLYIEVDEETNNILTIDWKIVPGFDAELVAGLYKRIAMLPKSIDKKELWILIGVALAVLICAYNAYQMGKVQEGITAIYNLVNASRAIGPGIGNIPPVG
jgi:hypothetical protein